MDPLNPSTPRLASDLSNLDPASRAEIQKVIEQESQKLALQQSIPPTIGQIANVDIQKHADMYTESNRRN